jgi:uncharacterized C2H2 Zn-finger protein
VSQWRNCPGCGDVFAITQAKESRVAYTDHINACSKYHDVQAEKHDQAAKEKQENIMLNTKSILSNSFGDLEQRDIASAIAYYVQESK